MCLDYLQSPQRWICRTHLTCHLSWLCLDQGFLFQGDHLFLCKKRQRVAFIWETISQPNKGRTENPLYTNESWISLLGGCWSPQFKEKPSTRRTSTQSPGSVLNIESPEHRVLMYGHHMALPSTHMGFTNREKHTWQNIFQISLKPQNFKNILTCLMNPKYVLAQPS